MYESIKVSDALPRSNLPGSSLNAYGVPYQYNSRIRYFNVNARDNIQKSKGADKCGYLNMETKWATDGRRAKYGPKEQQFASGHHRRKEQNRLRFDNMRLLDTPRKFVGNIPHNDKWCSGGYKTP
jgi:hypothetical protein